MPGRPWAYLRLRENGRAPPDTLGPMPSPCVVRLAPPVLLIALTQMVGCVQTSTYDGLSVLGSSLTLSHHLAVARGPGVSAQVILRQGNQPIVGAVVRVLAPAGQVTPLTQSTDAAGMQRFALWAAVANVVLVTTQLVERDTTLSLPLNDVVAFYEGDSTGALPAGQAIDLAFAVPNSSGRGHLWHFASSDANATLPADSSASTATGSTWVLPQSATFRTPGVQTLTATDTLTGATVYQEQVQVSAGAVAAFELQLADSATAGLPTVGRLRLRDAFGNPVNGAVGPLTLSSTPAGATGSVDPTADANGWHAVRCTLVHAGAQSVRISDGTTQSPDVVVTVTAADANSLTVQGDTNVVAGLPAPFGVRLQDAFGNLVAQGNHTVTFTCTDPNATLPGPSPLPGGVATFSVAFGTAGMQSLNFVVDDALALQSVPVHVAAGPASYFDVTAPASAVSGVAFSVTATARDSYGNLATLVDTVAVSSQYLGADANSKDVLPGPYTYGIADSSTHSFANLALHGCGRSLLTLRAQHAARVQGQAVVMANCTTATLGNACAIASENAELRCWGDNYYGQLGLGDKAARGTLPNQMGDALPAVDLGTGRSARAVSRRDNTCALLDDATVKCWGSNAAVLGSGASSVGGTAASMGDALPAMDLGSGVTAQAVTLADQHACALLTDGRVKCWGQNALGQLGLGDTADRGTRAAQMGDSLPAVDLGPGAVVLGLVANANNTCAVLADHSLRCWGSNNQGQLGLGDTTARGPLPGQMGAALPAIDLGTGRSVAWPPPAGGATVAVGTLHACAVLDNATLKCWGSSAIGQLGLGDTAARGDNANEMGDMLPPADLGAFVPVSVVAGSYHTCAVSQTGSIKCWGFAFAGNLGLGDDANRGDGTLPMGDALPVLALPAVRLLQSAGYSTTGLFVDGAVRSWGWNAEGMLGLGDTLDRGDAALPLDAPGDPLPVTVIW